MAEATVTVRLVGDFTGLSASFRQAADALDSLQASLGETPAPAPAAMEYPEHDSTGIDPQGP